MTTTEELTPLGRQLARLPLDVYLGKLVLYGCIYGCLDAAVTIAALLSSSRSPFITPMGYRGEADAARFLFKRGMGLLITEIDRAEVLQAIPICLLDGMRILHGDESVKVTISRKPIFAVEITLVGGLYPESKN